MSRKSTIKTLPKDLRLEIDRLLASGKYTFDDITNHVKSLGADVSRSAIHRYSKEFENVSKKMKEAREIAEAFAKSIDQMKDKDLSRVSIDILHHTIFEHILKQADTEDKLQTKDLMFLAKSINDLSKASKNSAEMELKIIKEVKEQSAKAVETAARKEGLSEETINRLKANVLGVKDG